MNKKIRAALISVFYKDGLEPVVRLLSELRVTIYSTGGTQKFIESLNIPVIPVEKLTSYPAILGGRVKTLHPSVFGGILGRRDNETDIKEMERYDIPEIDLVIVPSAWMISGSLRLNAEQNLAITALNGEFSSWRGPKTLKYRSVTVSIG